MPKNDITDNVYAREMMWAAQLKKASNGNPQSSLVKDADESWMDAAGDLAIPMFSLYGLRYPGRKIQLVCDLRDKTVALELTSADGTKEKIEVKTSLVRCAAREDKYDLFVIVGDDPPKRCDDYLYGLAMRFGSEVDIAWYPPEITPRNFILSVTHIPPGFEAPKESAKKK